MRGEASTSLAIAMRERRCEKERPRVPEPMAMDDPESVRQFHAGGAGLAGMRAVHELSARALAALIPRNGRLLDLGVGSGRALGRLLAIRPDVRATGVDLAPGMLAEARRFLATEGIDDRASLIEADLTALPARLRERGWDAVSSVWTLHHLPDRTALMDALRRVAEIRARHGAAIWLLDFQRLRDARSFPALTSLLHPDADPTLRRDALASEAAAFTREELEAALNSAGFTGLEHGAARPIGWLQAFWAPARGGAAPATPAEASLAEPVRRATERLSRSFSRLPF